MARPAAVDPWLGHVTWKRARAYWREQQAHRILYCGRCGYAVNANPGTAMSLDVGHVVDRVTARSLGWTVEQANAVENTRPEHRRCNRSAGAGVGNGRRRAAGAAPRTSRESSEW